MRWAISIVAFLLFSETVYSASIKPIFKKVKLQEFTSLELNVLPDGGTQLIFPFELDNPELQPSLKIRLTNANGFTVPTQEAEITSLFSGQNTISIMGLANEQNPRAVYIGQLFITIGGYNLSIGLKTTFKPSQHVSNVVFTIDESERNHMIERYVERRSKEMDRQYKEKIDSIDNMAMEKSLGYVAKMTTMSSSSTRFKESGDILLDGALMRIYVDKTINFDNKFEVLVFEIKNISGQTINLFGVELLTLDDENEKGIKGALECPELLKDGQKTICRFASINTNYRKAKKLKLLLNTNKGIGEFTW